MKSLKDINLTLHTVSPMTPTHRKRIKKKLENKEITYTIYTNMPSLNLFFTNKTKDASSYSLIISFKNHHFSCLTCITDGLCFFTWVVGAAELSICFKPPFEAGLCFGF